MSPGQPLTTLEEPSGASFQMSGAAFLFFSFYVIADKMIIMGWLMVELVKTKQHLCLVNVD